MLTVLLTTAALTGCGASGPNTAESTSSTSAPPGSFASCTARQLSVMGGRQGGGFQTAHADVNLKGVTPPDCLLNSAPTAIALVKADGTTLDVQYAPGTVTKPEPVLSPSGVVDLVLSWANWCGTNPGSLTIRISMPNGAGVVEGPFNGPPDYDYLPGCIQPGEPSTLKFTGYSGAAGSA